MEEIAGTKGAFMAGALAAGFVWLIIPPFYRRLRRDGHVPGPVEKVVDFAGGIADVVRGKLEGRNG